MIMRFVIKINSWLEDGDDNGGIIEHCSKEIINFELAKERARVLWLEVFPNTKKELTIFDRNFNEMMKANNFEKTHN